MHLPQGGRCETAVDLGGELGGEGSCTVLCWEGGPSGDTGIEGTLGSVVVVGPMRVTVSESLGYPLMSLTGESESRKLRDRQKWSVALEGSSAIAISCCLS